MGIRPSSYFLSSSWNLILCRLRIWYFWIGMCRGKGGHVRCTTKSEWHPSSYLPSFLFLIFCLACTSLTFPTSMKWPSRFLVNYASEDFWDTLMFPFSFLSKMSHIFKEQVVPSWNRGGSTPSTPSSPYPSMPYSLSKSRTSLCGVQVSTTSVKKNVHTVSVFLCPICNDKLRESHLCSLDKGGKSRKAKSPFHITKEGPGEHMGL